MQIVNGKLKLEAGDKIKLKDGRTVESIEFNPWDFALASVNINGTKECIWVSEIDVEILKLGNEVDYYGKRK